MKIYQSAPDEGFTRDEIKRGYSFLYMDIVCNCGKIQALTNLKPKGKCVQCNKKIYDL